MDENQSKTFGGPNCWPGMIIQQKDPDNLEMPFELLDDFITPSDMFYVRSHFPVPKLDRASYQLSIKGAVQNQLTLSYADLRNMPSSTLVATLECAGNSRVFLAPQVPGAQWALGAVGNAEWTGVPLSFLLEQAGLSEDVCDLVLEGADRGIPKEEPKPPGIISYARSISRNRATQPDVLIAYQMNGQNLTPDHGFPVRAIVPGHYGMASVKWLTGIFAVKEQFQGYWQTSDYSYFDYANGIPIRRPLAGMKLKAQIARPRAYERLAPNRTYTVFGAAWAGETDVTEIWISMDGGAKWVQAEFVDTINRNAWRRWKHEWVTPAQTGRLTLLARAVDANGRTQPSEHNPSYGGYVIDHSLPIEVFIADEIASADNTPDERTTG